MWKFTSHLPGAVARIDIVVLMFVCGRSRESILSFSCLYVVRLFIFILSTVRVKNLKLKKEFKYTLVSEKEQDLKEMKISVSSPVGKGLLGKEVGDVVEIQVPAGILEFEILEITREL